MTIVCALSHSPFAAHQSAQSTGGVSAGGAEAETDSRNSRLFIRSVLGDAGRTKRLVRRSSKSEGGSVPAISHVCSGGHGAPRLCPPLSSNYHHFSAQKLPPASFIFCPSANSVSPSKGLPIT